MDKMAKIVIDVKVAVLNEIPELHYKVCFEDISGRPEFNCVCPIKDIVKKLRDDEILNPFGDNNG